MIAQEKVESRIKIIASIPLGKDIRRGGLVETKDEGACCPA